jgi:transposase
MSSAVVVRASTIIYLGLDVHKDSVTIAVLPEGATAPTRIDKYPNDFAKLRRAFERLATGGEIRACYEASGAGYVLQRAMRDWGYHCDVIAPSLIPTKPGASTRNCEAASNARRTSTTKQRGFPAPPSAARYRRLDKLLLIEAATRG